MHIKCPRCHADNPPGSKSCDHCGLLLDAADKMSLSQTKTLETSKEELTTGSTFAERYQIIEELGKGGMGRVYKAQDTEVNEKVALKLIKPEIAADKKTIERFRNELKLARKVRHKNVCQMYDLNKEEGSYYITMEFVSGQDLKKLIRQTGKLAVSTAVSIAKQVCEGLSEAHKLGVVHRDLKSNNIMIDEDGSVRIMDFGIARSLKAKSITGSGVMIGTPEYMSPEQVEGKEVDQRSDIYSLGIILYEMVTGQVPFEGDTPFTIGVKHKSEIPKNPKNLNSNLPDDMSRVILRCLEKNKDSRYQSADELRSELINIEKGIPTTERAEPKRKSLTSKEITVTFGLKKLLIPALTVIAIVIAALIIWSPWSQKEAPPPPSEKPSVAVLPFEDFSPQKDQEYLCMGIAAELINRLNKVQDLWVPARASSFSFKGKEASIQEIGSKLNVNTVLIGTLQKAESRLRISIELVNVTDNNTIWQETYQKDEGDIFNLQDEISLAVLESLKVELLGEERGNLVKRDTENTEAYHLFLKGQHHENRIIEEGQIKAIDYYQQAINKDPNYALAYAGLARCYVQLTPYLISPEEASIKAKAAIMKALEIDESLSETHCTMGIIFFWLDWDWPAAEREHRRAIELDPNNAEAHYWYASFLAVTGRHDEAISEISRALELDPISILINRSVAWNYYYARDYERALEYYHKALELNPNDAIALRDLGRVYLKKGMNSEAIASVEKAVEISSGDRTRAKLAAVYAESGKKSEAIAILDDILEQSEQRYISPALIAEIFASLRENDKAFEWLEKAYEERDSMLSIIKASPQLDSLRSDPRFKELLKKMNLE